MKWSDTTAWEDGTIANGVGATATFRPDTGYIICTLDTPVTLGHWVFENVVVDSSCRYRMEDDPWQRVQLATTDGTPSITVNSYVTAMFRFPLGGSQGLDKFGAGTLDLHDNTNYTGVTTVYNGILEVWANESLGEIGVGNETIVLSGGNLTIGADLTVSEAITISGIGCGNNHGALRLYGNTEFAGAITLNGDATITQDEYYDEAAGKITGNIATNGADLTFLMESYTQYAIDEFTTTVSGNISGAGGVYVVSGGTYGTGTLVLSGTNTFSGGISVSDETAIRVSSDANLGATSNDIILNNGGLKVTGTSYTSTDRDFEIQSGGGTITIDNSSNSFTLTGNLRGDGGLIKDGSGALSLTGNNNNFSGNITVKAGTLGVGINDSLGSETSVIVKSGATVQFEGDEDFGSLAGDSSATVDLNGCSIRFGSDNTDTTYKGTVSGAGKLRKFGTGTQTITGNLTFTGDIEVQKGQMTLKGNNEAMTGDVLIQNGATLRIEYGRAINDNSQVTMEAGSTFIVLDNETTGSLSGDGTVNTAYFATSSGAALTVGNDNTDTTFSGSIIGETGKLTKIGSGTFILSGHNTYTGKTTVSEGTLALSGENVLASTNIEIQSGALLQASLANSLSSSANVAIAENATLELLTGGEIESLTGQGTVYSHGQELIVGAGNSSFTFGGTLDDVILTKRGTGTFTIAAERIRGFDATVEAGTLRFETWDPNSYGLITVQSGARIESTDDGIGDHNDLDVAAGATLVLEENETIGSLSGAGTVVLPSPETPGDGSIAEVGLTVCAEGSSNNFIFSGTISGEGYLWKTGSHHLTLSNANSYTGGTIIEGGCIIADHNQALGTGSVLFNGGELQINEGITFTNTIEFDSENGGVLCGSGTLQDNLVAGNRTIIAPGNHPSKSENPVGQLTITGNYTQGDSSYLHIQLAGTTDGDYDVLNVTGQVTLGGTLYLALLEGFTPVYGDTFDILDWGTITAENEFKNFILPSLDEGLYWNMTELYSTGEISVSDNTGIPGDANNDGMVDGSDVTILAGNWQYGVTPEASAVPEPTTLVLLLTLTLLALPCRYHSR